MLRRPIRPTMASAAAVRADSLIVKYYRMSEGTSFTMQVAPDENKGFVDGAVVEQDARRRLGSWAIQPYSTVWALFDEGDGGKLRVHAGSIQGCRFRRDTMDRGRWVLQFGAARKSEEPEDKKMIPVIPQVPIVSMISTLSLEAESEEKPMDEKVAPRMRECLECRDGKPVWCRYAGGMLWLCVEHFRKNLERLQFEGAPIANTTSTTHTTKSTFSVLPSSLEATTPDPDVTFSSGMLFLIGLGWKEQLDLSLATEKLLAPEV